MRPAAHTAKRSPGGTGGAGVTAILAPLAEELAPVRWRSRSRRRLPLRHGRGWSARLAGRPVVLLHCGDGARRAGAALTELLRYEGCPPLQLVLGIGVGGALNAELAPGALVACRDLRVPGAHGDQPDWEAPDAGWLRCVLSLGGVQAGTVVNSSRIVDTPAERQALYRDCDVPPGAAVVDLESLAWARAATAAGVPYLIVRAVSDTVGERFPLDLNACLDGEGGVDRARVVRRALRHPGSLPGLMRLRRRVSGCADRLADVVESLVAASAGGCP